MTKICANEECGQPFEPVLYTNSIGRISGGQVKFCPTCAENGARGRTRKVPDLAVDLPTMPTGDWEPRRVKLASGTTRHLFRRVDGLVTDEVGFFFREKNGVASWAVVPIRSVVEGAERNAKILEWAKPILKGPDAPMTLRHLFYLAVTAGQVTNKAAEYAVISKVMTRAREDGEVDDDSITDEHRTVMAYGGYTDLAEFAADEPEYYYRKKLWPSQDNHIEFWFEKSAVMSTVERLHTAYQVTMRPFKGQASRAYCARIAADFAKIDEPVTVYYLGDHDPSGYCIPASGEERVREILAAKPYYGKNCDFKMVRLGFNPEHFEEHNIESWDVDDKITDSNYRKFIDRFGDIRNEKGEVKCAELDAIPPDELRDIVRTAIRQHITNQDAWDELRASEETDRERIRQALVNL
jgi:hypothetical protein